MSDKYLSYEWKYQKSDFKFCPRCGSTLSLEDLHIPNQPQLVCDACQFIFYLDPKVAVSVLVVHQGKVLLLRRAEEPGKGLWAFPAGHVERGMDPDQVVLDEVREETGLEIRDVRMIGHLTSPASGTILLIYQAAADQEDVTLNLESLEGRFFAKDEIPWSELAFPLTRRYLGQFFCVDV